MLETNLILNSKDVSISNYLKQGELTLLYEQYKDILEFKQNESKFILKDIERKKENDINFFLLFPVASKNNTNLYAVTYKNTSELINSTTIENLAEYVNSIKQYINKVYGFPVDNSFFKGRFEIEAENIEGKSHTVAIWLTIFLTNFSKNLPNSFCITGEIDFDNFQIKKVDLVDKKITAFEREFLNKNRRFFYSSKNVYNDKNISNVTTVKEVLEKIGFDFNFKRFDLPKKEWLKIVEDIENKDFYNAKTLYLYLMENFNLLEHELFKANLYLAHYYNKLGNLELSKKYYNNIKYDLPSFPDIASKFYSRFINMYLDEFNLKEAENVIESFKTNLHFDYTEKLYNSLGNINYLKNNIENAIQNYKLAMENSDEKGILRTKNHLINCYLKTSNYENADKIVLSLINNPNIDNFNFYYILKYHLLTNTKINDSFIEKYKPEEKNIYIDLIILLIFKYKYFKYFKKYESKFEELKNSLLNSELIDILYLIYENYLQNKDIEEQISLVKDSKYYKKCNNFANYFEELINSNKIKAKEDLLLIFIWI